jgi:phospholipid/cholesterol/gamma-HCH transport system substrate-binding protein
VNSKRVIGAGAFVAIGLLLFTVGLFMIGERRMLFESRFPVYVEFATLGQLEVGAVVRVAGADAGEVTDIHVPAGPADKFRVKMEVREDLHPLVRTDSVATAQTEGLVGAIYVNIQTGSAAAPQLPDGGTIQSKEPFSMADLLEQMSETVTTVNQTVTSISGDLEKTIQQISATTADAQALLADVKPDIEAIAHNGARVSADAQLVMQSVREGRGTIGKLINDDTLYQQVKDITTQAKTVMGNVQDVTTEARRAIADFRSDDGPAQGLLGDMRVTVTQAREATADFADNMEALKHNFLLRGFFNSRGYFDLDAISPADYRSGVLENGKRKAMRIWLSSAVLFEAGPEGQDVLTDGGRTRLDSAMSTFLQYIPANPIVVEGYAMEGTTDERFRRARQRAGIVREYVLGRYGLQPQNTGYIALGNDAQGSPADGRWEGIALTLFLDRESLQFGDQASR